LTPRNWKADTGKETAANLRSLDGIRDLSFGRWCLTIDDADYQALTQRFPELSFENGEIDKDLRTRAWRRFMKSSASEPYRVQQDARRS